MANEPDIVQNTTIDVTTDGTLSVGFSNTPQQIEVQSEVLQQLSAVFDVVNDLNVNFDSNPQELTAQFGTIYTVSGDCKVLYATTATWNSQPTLISARGYIYLYADYKQNSQGQDIAGMKVGDGQSYLIDMPFTDSLLYDHADNTVIHLTQDEREFWNNKVRCYIDPQNEQNIVFTTN